MASTDYVGQVQARMESLADGFMARAISLAQADMAVLDEQLEHARKKLRGEKGALVTASSALAPPSRAPLATITEASNSPRVEAAAAKPAPRAPPAAAAAAARSSPITTNESDSVAKARALVESYTFKELQRELKSRELRAAGKKQELKARLEGALVAELEAAPDVEPPASLFADARHVLGQLSEGARRALREEPGLQRRCCAGLCGNQPVHRVHPTILH